MNSLRTSGAVAGLLILVLLGSLLAVEIDPESNFNTDFEADENYSPGPLTSDPIWNIEGTSQPEVGSFAYTGLLGLNLDDGDAISIDFNSLLAPTVGWVDLFLKPTFSAPENLPTSFPLGQAALTGFVTVDDNGEVYVLHGDGAGNGVWMATGYVVPLSGQSSLDWLRLTYRLDYGTQRWDLFVDNALQMIDLGFVDASAPPLSKFTLEGSTEGNTHFDQFTAGFINPLFTDADNDGIDDAYESAQGLSTSSNDRDGDADLDSISNVVEFMDGLEAGNADTDGDGVHDGAERDAGADPAVADSYNLEAVPYLEDFEAYSAGDLASQSLWQATGGTALIQNANSFGSSQALELQAGTSTLELGNDFDGSAHELLWFDFYLQPRRFENPSADSVSGMLVDGSSAVFYFLEGNQLAVLDGNGDGTGTWSVLDHASSGDAWTRVTIRNDYQAQQFQIWINNVPVAGTFGYFNQQPYFSKLTLSQNDSESAFLDQIQIATQKPQGLDTDGDGLADDEEDLNGNGVLDAGETDPFVADSDGDGINDGAGIKLRLWLRSDTGVEVDGSNLVLKWEDQSIYQMDASQSTAALQPSLTADAYNSQPAIQFDGVDDYLEGVASFDPSAGDFTMIVVHRKTGGHDKSAPFSYSTSSTANGAPLLRWGPEANNFGLNNVGVNADGVYVDLGPDHADKLYIASASRSGGVNGLNANVTVSALAHNESVQTTGVQNWTSGSASGFFVGKKKVSNDHMFGGDILEIMVYEGVLSPEQTLQINQQLAVRYGLSLDLDFDGLSDEWEESTFGSFEWNALDDPDGDGINNIREFNLGTDGNVPDATDIIQSNPGLRLRLEASAAVLDTNGLVEQLPDLSGWNEHASQDDPAKRPALLTAALGGQDALSLDGVDDYLAGNTDFDASAGDFTLIAVASQSATNGLAATLSYSSSDTALGAPIMRWKRPDAGDLGINDVGRGVDGSFVSLGENAVDQIQLISIRRSGGDAYGLNGQLTVRALSDMQTLENTTAQSWVSASTAAYFLGRKKTTPDGNNDLFSGQIAEILVFDRALTHSELFAIEEFLAAKYQIILDIDADGWEDSFERSLFGSIGESPDSDYDLDGLSNARELNLGFDPLVEDTHSPVLTMDGLGLWLSADQGLTVDAAGLVSEWSDISGYGAAIAQSSVDAQPLLVADALNAESVVKFDGVDDFLLGDAGFAPASGDYSLFVVHRRTGGHDKAATISFNQPAGSTGAPLLRWGPDADHLGINNVGVNADGVYADLGAGAGDYLVSSVIRSLPADPSAAPQIALSNESYSGLFTATGPESWSSALSSEFALARKADGTTHFFGGEIAEVLLFKRALSAEDLSTVEAYLKNKYQINSDIDGDGLDNLTEQSLGTDPLLVDSDNDGMDDGWEHSYSLDPLNALDAPLNPDDDMLSNLQEYLFGTNPLELDSDNDGLEDGYGLAGGVQREIWNLGGSRLNFLYNDNTFPGTPDSREWLYQLEIPRNEANYYGGRVRGYIIPDQTREYVFHLTGRDQTEFWLSTNHHAYNRSLMVEIESGLAWDKWESSATVTLEAGVRYYFEVLQKENSNADHFRVGWSQPNGNITVIPGANLMSYTPDPGDLDNDGLEDTWEQSLGLDPLDDGSTHKKEGGYGDFDLDGIINNTERALGTSAILADTDGDGFTDWVEREYLNTSPLNPNVSQTYAVSQIWQTYDVETRLNGVALEQTATGKLHLFGSGLEQPNAASDSMSYFYREVAGDFSVTISADKADFFRTYGRFEIMARESLTPDSRHVSLSSRNGELRAMLLLSRLTTGADNTSEEIHPLVDKKKNWLRLVRRGDTFLAYLSTDNATWTLLGQRSIDLPESIYLGFSLSSGLKNEYNSLVIDVAEFNTDFDRDGIWDDDESIYGTSVTDADSDGDGYSDYEEINQFFSDPTVADLGTETIADAATGSESIAELGDWIVDGAVTYAREGRGSVTYEMTLPEDAIYRIGLTAQSRFNQTGKNQYSVKVNIDGVYIGRLSLNHAVDEAGVARILTPWLKAGTHTIEFYVDNTYTYRSLQINQIELGYVGGADTDLDNVPDWMTNRLATLNGFDNATAGAVTQSQISPFCLKGRSRYLDFSQSTDPSIELNPFPGFEFYADIPLSATADTTATIDFENQGLTQTAQIEWVSTNLADTPEITIRKGDALLLTAFTATTQPADAVELDLGDGTAPVTTTMNAPVEAVFDQAGEYALTATVGGVVYPMTVTVLEADLGESYSLMVGRKIPYQPSSLSFDATVEVDSMIAITETSAQGDPRSFDLLASEFEPAVLAASTPSGDVLDHVDLQTFYLASNDQTHVSVLETFDNGDKLVSTNIVLDEVPDDIAVTVTVIAAGVTFSDGSIVKVLTAEDFDELGRATLYFISPDGAVTFACHRISVDLGDLSLGNI